MAELNAPLTERELEVAELVGRGYSAERIAIELECAKRTVHQHIVNIARKIPGSSRPYIRVLLWVKDHGGA